MDRKYLIMAGYGLLGVLCSFINVDARDTATVESPPMHEQEADARDGVIGVSLHIGADRVGEPAVLYVAMVHPDGPASAAGVSHGDEITSVDGATVSGKTYEQLVRMIRGTVGTPVKIGVKGEAGTRELSIRRISSENLSEGPPVSERSPSR